MKFSNPLRRLTTRRTKFASRAKPRSTRGISKKGRFTLRKRKTIQTGLSMRADVQPAVRRSKYDRLPEWTDPRSKLFPGGREKLYGADKTARRRELFERSDGRCEAKTLTTGIVYQGIEFYFRCNRPITWESMEWSHKKHGRGKRDDSMTGGIASCKPCHRAVHNPKPCLKKERQA